METDTNSNKMFAEKLRSREAKERETFPATVCVMISDFVDKSRRLKRFDDRNLLFHGGAKVVVPRR